MNQAQSSPVGVPAQITVLLALGGGLFDPVPIDKMAESERAVRDAAKQIPLDVGKWQETCDKLSDEEREAIVATARRALVPFQPSPSPTTQRRARQVSSPFLLLQSPKASMRPVRGAMSNTTADLQAVVRTMKALAASSIGQYEESVQALADDDRTVVFGLGACLQRLGPLSSVIPKLKSEPHR